MVGGEYLLSFSQWHNPPPLPQDQTTMPTSTRGSLSKSRSPLKDTEQVLYLASHIPRDYTLPCDTGGRI